MGELDEPYRDLADIVLPVRDNGRGIAPDLLPRVFDQFCQVAGQAKPVTGGLGIGLALVKSLVELHGGSVTAFSDCPGSVCEFVVRLPALATPGRLCFEMALVCDRGLVYSAGGVRAFWNRTVPSTTPVCGCGDTFVSKGLAETNRWRLPAPARRLRNKAGADTSYSTSFLGVEDDGSG
jgi:hypothetical protein